ncbi:MAG: hypothetical protein J6V82_01910, partial [Clostridia bacterium]|nr:hypothetical protein [Clostridia bacterium]
TNGNRGIFVAKIAGGTLSFENCHVINGTTQNNNGAAGFFLGTATTGATVTIENCTASGSMKGSQHSTAGGFVGTGNTAKIIIENSVSSLSTSGVISTVGGFVGSSAGGAGGTEITNCIFDGNIVIEGGGSAGGIQGSTTNNTPVKIEGCAVYGTISTASGYAGGIFASHGNNSTLNMKNCVVYGTVSSKTGYAGGIVGGFSGGYHKTYVSDILVLATVYTTETGVAGAVVGYLNPGKDNRGSYTNIYTTSDTYVGAVDETYKNTVVEAYTLPSATTLPETFSTDVWEIGAFPEIAGISVTLGNSISLNVYIKDKTAIMLKALPAKLFVDGRFVTAGEKVTVEINGEAVECVKFVYDSLNPADFEKALGLSVTGGNAAQMTYAVTDYVIHTYAAATGDLQALLKAILYYGDAAQMAAYGTSTILANASAALETEFLEGYVNEKFAVIDLKTNNMTVTTALDLDGTIIPVFAVPANVTNVTVTIYGKTTELVIVDGKACFYGLNATSLNNPMYVNFYEGDELVLEGRCSVASYVEAAVSETSTLTDSQKTLAKALAVYMRAARDYLGLN